MNEQNVILKLGDCLEVLRTMPDNSIDSCVTDPPYGLSFMGKSWDYNIPNVDVWLEVLRVLKPGGHLLAFAGTRTHHRMAVAIEDAGFEIRDMIAWVYGSGFPKSLDVSKAIDKTDGAERQVVGVTRASIQRRGHLGAFGSYPEETKRVPITAPATEAAHKWNGWGTALKPAMEPISVARKPFKGTVAANVLEHGTGAINIDGCRVGYASDADRSQPLAGDAFKRKDTSDKGWSRPWMENADRIAQINAEAKQRAGRFPANLIHDGSDDVLDLFPGDGEKSAARFFYCAKASKSDRSECNHHPTVKPTDLMRYLCRLVTSPGGIVLDPFMGSGSTGKAAIIEGFQFIGIEMDEDYMKIAEARIQHELEKSK